MKKYLLLSFLLALSFNLLSAQGLFELKVKQLSLEPDYKTEQVHVLTLTNTSKSKQTFKITSENFKCVDTRTRKNSDLEHTIRNTNSRKNADGSITLSPSEVHEFSIKIKKPAKAALGSINCTKVIATTVGAKPAPKSVMIKSFIPDPKNAN